MKRILLGIFASILLLSSCTEKISQPQLLRCHIDTSTFYSVTISFDAEVPENEIGHYVALTLSTKDPIDDEDRIELKKSAEPGRHSYTFSYSSLMLDSLYYARAYVYQGKAGLEWGEPVTFTPTLVITSEMVDLGLSVNWRSYNLGVSDLSYGLYYQWADTQGYGQDVQDGKVFDYCDTLFNPTYKWANGSLHRMTKYYSGDSFTVLQMEDDAARVALGGNWRVPTKSEWKELWEECDWGRMTVKGVYGALIYSKKEGYTDNFIFLPFCGYREGYKVKRVNEYANYWSSNLNTSSKSNVWTFATSPIPGGWSILWSYNDRSFGLPIRPVADKTE